MKKGLLACICLLVASIVSAQNFRGQWKGEFTDKSTSFPNFGGDKCDYVLELETKGQTVNGYSYTYFMDGGKRYYTICRLQGFINRKAKYIEVKEVERTKTNVPNTIRNCFQIHKLTYFKQGTGEILEGNWVPVPNQEGDCGYGYTSLTRRVLQSAIPAVKNSLAKATVPVKKSLPPVSALKDKNKVTPPARATLATRQPVLRPKKPIIKDLATKDPAVIPVPDVLPVPQAKINVPPIDFKKRNINLLKTIVVASDMIRVDLYDNGEIDGDSVSLFYNGKLLAAHKRLSDKAITYNLPVDKDMEVNELVMYADNLGTIPPNTALMVVTDGVRRYEVRITSDLQKSGVIHFVHESKGN